MWSKEKLQYSCEHSTIDCRHVDQAIGTKGVYRDEKKNHGRG